MHSIIFSKAEMEERRRREEEERKRREEEERIKREHEEEAERKHREQEDKDREIQVHIYLLYYVYFTRHACIRQHYAYVIVIYVHM